MTSHHETGFENSFGFMRAAVHVQIAQMGTRGHNFAGPAA